MTRIRKDLAVLEVGFGTGRILLELVGRTGNESGVHGIDVSKKMIKRTKRLIHKSGLYDNVHTVLGDARNLPYKNEMFDIVFNSHMLDLIDTFDIPKVVLEFKRVLKPRGRLVLVNLTKGNSWNSNMRIYEWVYRRWPSLLGGCRPVLARSVMESVGFEDVNRELVMASHLMPIEIVWGDKA